MSAPAEVDLVIRGGDVVDGTGAPRRRADVAVQGDTIVGVAPGLSGRREIDASGLVVAPGFIDVHTHYDAQVFWDPALTPSCFHGVTTVVAGNCGYSLAPLRDDGVEILAATLERVEDMNLACLLAGVPWQDFRSYAEYRAAVRRRGPVLNFGTYVGHSTLRLAAMGPDAYERECTPRELASMVRLLRESIEAGAMGLSTSFAPTHLGWRGLRVPSRHAGRDEFAALARAAAAAGAAVVEVALGDTFELEELYDLQRELGIPLTYGALVAMEGLWPTMLELHEKETAAGADVWPQVTPRPVTMQVHLANPYPFNDAPAFRELITCRRHERVDAYRDPAWRRRAIAAMADLVPAPRFDHIFVDESAAHPELIGRSMVAIGAERGVHPFDAMVELSLDEDLTTRFRTVLAGEDEVGIRAILASDHVALSFTDAGAHVGMLCDAVMQTDVLGRWVREEGVLGLEAAVRKMTGQLADTWQIAGRGYVREGAFADLVIFDPATVGPGPVRRVRDFPAGTDRLTAEEPTGVVGVLVNGTQIVTEGSAAAVAVDPSPGRVVRPGSA
jgi:N-acyl-D-aspartate/D-glutamate deacylase